MEPNVKLGNIQPTPSEFNPSYVYIEGDYLYKVDTKVGIVMRAPLSWQSSAAKMYFAIAPATSDTKKRRKRELKFSARLFVTVATALFVSGGFLVAYPLYPAVQYQVSRRVAASTPFAHAETATPVSEQNVLKIPKIGLSTPILEAPTLKILDHKEGVWHQRGALANNFVLAGHRWKYLPPNVSTFYNLDKLEVGDSIIIDWFKQRYVYTVTEKKVVAQSDDAVIQPTGKPHLTLYTCYDRQETQRVVVIATPLP